VCASDTPYYHVTSRCVRRAFLCGIDRYSGKNYEHRRDWIEHRLRMLSSVFCIDVCAYAVSADWSEDEVLKRWTTLFRGPYLVQQAVAGKRLSVTEQQTLHSIVSVYKERLGSLSWFMKCLNEPIARQANAEDRCTGHFWEARFHSQALKTDAALLSAMAYVDLNPVRAKMAKTPETSQYTSIRSRIKNEPSNTVLRQAIQDMVDRGELPHFDLPIRPLMAFEATESNQSTPAIPMCKRDYYRLVDATGRIQIRGKRGAIDSSIEPILTRLDISPQQWQQASTQFRSAYRDGKLRVEKAS